MPEFVSYLPVGLVSIGVAWVMRRLRPVVLQVFIALIVPTLVSAMLAIAPELIEPSPPGEGGMAWALILAASWTIIAVPICLISVTIFNIMQRQTKK
ncbi:MAG: hypothetical protein PHF56_23265 [Desulfuromonadaceae bacterium]|nr:hypothetical protein [Desulfuromonadaceae bacterium]